MLTDFQHSFTDRLTSKSQIPLRYPASEPACELLRELVCDQLANC